MSSPASKSKRLTAESVTSSVTRAIGLRCSSTSFLTYSIFSFSGSLREEKIFGTIRPPTTSCPWKVQPTEGSYLLVLALPTSCNRAAQRSHTFGSGLDSISSSATLSRTWRVWSKLSLCPLPSITFTPFRAVRDGSMSSSSPASSIRRKALDGLGTTSILFSSSAILSRVRI